MFKVLQFEYKLIIQKLNQPEQLQCVQTDKNIPKEHRVPGPTPIFLPFSTTLRLLIHDVIDAKIYSSVLESVDDGVPGTICESASSHSQARLC